MADLGPLMIIMTVTYILLANSGYFVANALLDFKIFEADISIKNHNLNAI